MSSMSPFDHDSVVEGTNRSAPVQDCKTCGGDRFVPVEAAWLKSSTGTVEYEPAMMPCPACNSPAPLEPVATEAWWKV